jgi:hypothetical protein
MDGVVWQWDMAHTGAGPVAFYRQTQPIWSVAWSPSDQIVAAGSNDGHVLVWFPDSDSGEEAGGVPATPISAEPRMLFEADWSIGLDGWITGPPDTMNWHTSDGILINDGEGIDSYIWAPYVPGDASITDYAVDAEVRIDEEQCGDAFAIGVRAEGGPADGHTVGRQESYWAGYNCGYLATIWLDVVNPDPEWQKAQTQFNPKSGWHTYRVEVQASTVRLLIDGELKAEWTDDQDSHPAGGMVGLWAPLAKIEVRRLAVYEL